MTEPIYQTTYTGKDINVLDFRPDDFDIIDVAHALSNICRWGGHTPWFYSVAQHSLCVSEELRRAGFGAQQQLRGLVHDGGEAYTGDLIRPIKNLDRFSEFTFIEDQILRTIGNLHHLGLVMNPVIIWYDNKVLQTEQRWVTEKNRSWYNRIYRAGLGVVARMTAKKRFLKRYRELTSELGIS